MKLVDASVLLYAVDVSAPRHVQARSWLDRTLSGRESVLLPWVCLLAFVRISTHPSIFPQPLRGAQACDVIDAWLARPNVVTVAPGVRHAEGFRRMLEAAGAGGNLVNDAHIAAMAREHGAIVVTFDRDFDRFTNVPWERPS